MDRMMAVGRQTIFFATSSRNWESNRQIQGTRKYKDTHTFVLKTFYIREGYASQGNPLIASVLDKEGP